MSLLTLIRVLRVSRAAIWCREHTTILKWQPERTYRAPRLELLQLDESHQHAWLPALSTLAVVERMLRLRQLHQLQPCWELRDLVQRGPLASVRAVQVRHATIKTLTCSRSQTACPLARSRGDRSPKGSPRSRTTGHLLPSNLDHLWKEKQIIQLMLVMMSWRSQH